MFHLIFVFTIMTRTYTQMYIHLVFAVKGRRHLIPRSHKTDVYRYITEIVKRRGHKLLAINGMSDHIHILIGLNPATAIASLVRDIKSVSSRFINESGWVSGRFAWQRGYGAFSYSRSHLHRVIRYIQRQEQHHAKQNFQDEFMEILTRFEVPYDSRESPFE